MMSEEEIKQRDTIRTIFEQVYAELVEQNNISPQMIVSEMMGLVLQAYLNHAGYLGALMIVNKIQERFIMEAIGVEIMKDIKK